MPLTVAQIAAKALNAASSAITDATHAATLTRTGQGDYNVTTGTYDGIPLSWTGRAVFCNAGAVRDAFPAYIIGPTDQLFLLEGFTPADTFTAKKNDILTIGGVERTITAVQDIAGAGSVFYAIAR